MCEVAPAVRYSINYYIVTKLTVTKLTGSCRRHRLAYLSCWLLAAAPMGDLWHRPRSRPGPGPDPGPGPGATLGPDPGSGPGPCPRRGHGPASDLAAAAATGTGWPRRGLLAMSASFVAVAHRWSRNGERRALLCRRLSSTAHVEVTGA